MLGVKTRLYTCIQKAINAKKQDKTNHKTGFYIL